MRICVGNKQEKGMIFYGKYRNKQEISRSAF